MSSDREHKPTPGLGPDHGPDPNPELSPELRLLKLAVRPPEPPTTDACLDAEQLAAWMEDGLSANAGAAVESHLAGCARCQAMLAAFAGTETDAAQVLAQRSAVVVPFRPRRVMRWLLPAAGLAAASLAGWAIWPRPPITTPQVSVLSKAEPSVEAPFGKTSVTPPSAAIDQIAPATPRADQLARAEQKSNAASARELGSAAAAPPVPGVLPLPAPMTTTASSGAPPGASGATALPQVPPVPPARDVSVLSGGPEMINLRATATKTEAASALQSRVVAEFGPPTAPAPAIGQSFLGGVRGGGGAGGAGGRGAQAAGAVRAPERVMPHVKWRVLASGQVAKAINGSDTWELVTIKPTVSIVNGAAPSDAVCWLVGRAGVVLLSTDGGQTFTRPIFPHVTDLRSITAVDARQATITTMDGHVYETSDGGETWQIK